MALKLYGSGAASGPARTLLPPGGSVLLARHRDRRARDALAAERWNQRLARVANARRSHPRRRRSSTPRCGGRAPVRERRVDAADERGARFTTIRDASARAGRTRLDDT